MNFFKYKLLNARQKKESLPFTDFFSGILKHRQNGFHIRRHDTAVAGPGHTLIVKGFVIN